MNKKIYAIIETLLVGVLVFVLTVTNALSALDYIARDGIYQVPRGIDSNIKIIGIDEKTMDEYGPIQTWSRSQYAKLIEKLNESEDSKPLIIGFDIQFSGNVDEGDEEFAQAAKESGNVVVVEQLIYKKAFQTDDKGRRYIEEAVVDIDEPYDALKESVLIGYSNVAQDSDGTVRRVIPEEKRGDETHKTFAKVIYQEYCKLTGTTENIIPTDKTGRSIINYSGRPGDYEYISMADVMDGKIDSRAFGDSIVLVGAYAPGMQDSFVVPNGGSLQMFGVEIHANILQSYLQGRFAIEGNPIIYGLIMSVLAMILSILFRKLRPWQSLIIIVASIIGEALILTAINNNGHAFTIIYFPIIIVIAYIGNLAKEYILEKARKKKVLDAFSKYVAPQIIDEISKGGYFSH